MIPTNLPESIRDRVLEALSPSQHEWELTPEEIFEALLNSRGIYGFAERIISDLKEALGVAYVAGSRSGPQTILLSPEAAERWKRCEPHGWAYPLTLM